MTALHFDVPTNQKFPFQGGSPLLGSCACGANVSYKWNDTSPSITRIVCTLGAVSLSRDLLEIRTEARAFHFFVPVRDEVQERAQKNDTPARKMQELGHDARHKSRGGAIGSLSIGRGSSCVTLFHVHVSRTGPRLLCAAIRIVRLNRE